MSENTKLQRTLTLSFISAVWVPLDPLLLYSRSFFRIFATHYYYFPDLLFPIFPSKISTNHDQLYIVQPPSFSLSLFARRRLLSLLGWVFVPFIYIYISKPTLAFSSSLFEIALGQKNLAVCERAREAKGEDAKAFGGWWRGCRFTGILAEKTWRVSVNDVSTDKYIGEGLFFKVLDPWFFTPNSALTSR